MTFYELEKKIDKLAKKVKCLECCSSGDGEAAFTELTYAEAQALVEGNTVVPGTMYLITDRGIFIEGLTPNSFTIEGHRIMLVPTYYGTDDISDGNVWLGVWNGSLTPSVGDLVIWGGQVWSNVAGNVGTDSDYDQLNSEWVLIDKATFSNGEYTEKVFTILFDFNNDWIERQEDYKGNIVGVSYAYWIDNSMTASNYVDVTDWNLSSGGGEFHSNVCYGIFNNSCESIYNNKAQVISYNFIGGNIYNNICYGDITQNENDGDINDNHTHYGGIDGNTGTSYIASNIIRGSINYNSSSEIYSNICGDILSNTAEGVIQQNIVTQSISNNTLATGGIDNNTCGSISGNNVGGNITHNIGVLLINNNTIAGDISDNRNTGAITGNNFDGDLIYNSNNGDITNCAGSNGFSVLYNTNNGEINNPAGLAVGDITDAIVNK